ncbi:MAG: peptidylprolyl isomerase [Paucibacter sp.]|nr:peptidylprolyl isomerase [Roseateles sp.]
MKPLSSPRRLAIGLLLALASVAGWAQTVQLVTTEGVIRIELDATAAPKSVANFVQYVKAGFYNGTIFHRVIENFMIQGGGFTDKLQQKPTRAPIPLESHNGLKNVRGSVAMARTNVPDSATSQFFINTVDNDFLNAENSRDGQGYAVFGRVIEGMDVVDKIRAAAVENHGMFQNIPSKPIIITKAILEPQS